ncbi:MAG: hypothetical protein ACK4Y5_16515 [Acetobacteraceae bacterium]
MTAAAWIALASFGVVVLAHVIAGAYFFGAQNQRIKTLEDEPRDDCAKELAALNATVRAMKDQVDRIEKRIDAVAQPIPTPRRRAA